ncbi:MAG: alkane 1-monooxygenase [Aquabacterium sp.]|uniref:alkane 1-monooxygenase n=1 Tax=Aquabacterium sp. TaxID=1872578 RepID=UPI0025C633DA|nr:alkane 1-monooxygenase [Aquabacterium sp.]MBI3381546.1 alkane 1-monooxygenase [Aquabacterium sp.]
MPAALPLPTQEQDPASYRDRKKIMWLLSVIAPATVVVGPVAYLNGYTHPLWFFASMLAIYLGVPLLDYLLGEDLSNPPEGAVPRLEADGYYRWINYLVVPVLWGSLLFNVVFLATHDLAWYEWLATVIITGSMLGFGLNLSHELGHKKDWIGRKMGLFNSALGGYGHFSIEHNRGHHRHVATPEDPASSKMGESIYRFMFRELPGAYFRAWDLETERLDRVGKSVWSLDNEIVQAGLVTALLYGGLIAAFGPKMVPILAIVAFWGAFQLTSANYIEHYGLVRQKKPDGRYEHCQPHHSWNSNHIVSNLIVFHLQRHSDHHANPTRSYQSLRNFPELPTLPSGYFGMFLAAYVPPVWFAIMDKRVIKAVGGDADRINFLPAKRAMLMRRFGLTESASTPAAQPTLKQA